MVEMKVKPLVYGALLVSLGLAINSMTAIGSSQASVIFTDNSTTAGNSVSAKATFGISGNTLTITKHLAGEFLGKSGEHTDRHIFSVERIRSGADTRFGNIAKCHLWICQL
jgi:hypothetical protein